MSVSVEYTNKALKDLRLLERPVAQRIVKKIRLYAEDAHPLRHAKKLNPPFDDLYRFRTGAYRVIFELNSHGTVTVLLVLKIGHRKDVYE